VADDEFAGAADEDVDGWGDEDEDTGDDRLAIVPSNPTPLDGCEHEVIRRGVLELRDRLSREYWDLSEMLHSIYTNSYYIAWGFGSWRDYVVSELDFQTRKAHYLVSVYDQARTLSDDGIELLKRIGWSKAKEIVHLLTPENIHEWKQRLEGLSLREVIELVQGRKDTDDTKESKEKKDKDTSDREKPTLMRFSVYPAQGENINMALERAMEMGATDKAGHALDLIATEFLATNAGNVTLKDYLQRVERSAGVRLVALDPKKDVIVFGDELLDQITTGDAPEGTEEATPGLVFPDPKVDLDAFLTAVRVAADVPMVVFSGALDKVLFGQDVLDKLGDDEE
jgi:hypothetical protein